MVDEAPLVAVPMVFPIDGVTAVECVKHGLPSAFDRSAYIANPMLALMKAAEPISLSSRRISLEAVTPAANAAIAMYRYGAHCM